MSALGSPAPDEPDDAERALPDLLPALQAAPAGHRRLDLMIAFALGQIDIDSTTVLRLLLESAPETEAFAHLLGTDCPPYTTSLDAALPGENIILALYQPQRDAWTAVHRSRTGDVVGTGASEPLARRVAALKALAPSMMPRPASNDQAPPATPREANEQRSDTPPLPPIEPGRGRSGRTEDGDWEILW